MSCDAGDHLIAPISSASSVPLRFKGFDFQFRRFFAIPAILAIFFDPRLSA